LDLAAAARFYVAPRPIRPDDKAARLLDPEAGQRLAGLIPALQRLAAWDQAGLEALVREAAEAGDVKLGKIAQPLRAALTGSTTSPGLFEVMAVLGREETLGRLGDVVTNPDAATHQKD
jgi:glutamyl-tRNA synthetase